MATDSSRVPATFSFFFTSQYRMLVRRNDKVFRPNSAERRAGAFFMLMRAFPGRPMRCGNGNLLSSDLCRNLPLNAKEGRHENRLVGG